MNVLLAAYPVRGGVMTHLNDLAEQLPALGVRPFLAFPKRHKYLTESEILSTVSRQRILFYKNTDELANFALNNRISLFHVHSRLALREAVTVAEKLNVPLVFTVHGIFSWAAHHGNELRKVARIIAVGPAQSNSAPEFSDKMELILNGINTSRFRPAQFHYDENVPLHILWYGRTRGSLSCGAKAVDQAVDILRSTGRSITATLVGVAAGVSVTSMSRTGWLDDPRPLLRRAHITFGHGRSIREAMACGSIGFLLSHGYGGRICREWFLGENRPILSAAPEYSLPEPDPKVLSRAIMELDDDRRLLALYRQEARAIAERFFTVQEMARHTQQVYYKALRGSHGM